MKAFIDDFKVIRVESYDYINQISIDGYELKYKETRNNMQFFISNKELKLHELSHISINHQVYPLEIGVVTLRKEFNEKFQYDGPLGAIYHKTHTDFYVFSPVAKEIILVVDDNHYPMTFESPIWKSTVQGDLEGKLYYYLVKLVDTYKKANDPYTIASNHLGSIIVDMNKLYEPKYDYVELKKYTDAVIYEGHIRDMSITLDVESKGLFLGITEHSNKLGKSVLQYIKDLGITHLQLLPVFDFYGVDDFKKDELYNWGYNPMQYFAIEGWYSKDPSNPYLRMNEFRTLVDEAHKLNLGIIMDVVYNHVYERALFPYDEFVPGYFFRHDKNYQPTHSCFLENDVETTNYMVRRLIIDSLVHFVKVYKVDGFRFDLMGLLDVETMNLIEKELRKINPNVILYGEGWNMDVHLPLNLRSNMNNQHLMNSIGHFNDFYRNTFKGQLHTKELGYATGATNLTDNAKKGIIGSPHMFSSPIKSINYVECHDNMTLYDTLQFNYQDKKTMRIYQDFANHLIAISQGVPFYHAGQEIYRTKYGEENSYNCKDDINQIIWYDYTSVEVLKDLLSIRKKYDIYRLDYYDKDKVKIKNRKTLIIYELIDKDFVLTHYIKNNFSKSRINKKGKVIFSSQNYKENHDTIIIDKPGVYIIKRKRD